MATAHTPLFSVEHLRVDAPTAAGTLHAVTVQLDSLVGRLEAELHALG